MSDTLQPRTVRYARYATLLWNRCDFRDLHAKFRILQVAQLTIVQTRIGTHTHLYQRRSGVDGGINLNFRCHPWNSHISVRITFASQCTVVRRRGTTRNDERAFVKMRKSARCSLLLASETSNTRVSARSDSILRLIWILINAGITLASQKHWNKRVTRRKIRAKGRSDRAGNLD